MTSNPYSVVIRRATEADAATLERLAALDDALPLVGDVLLAEVDGRALAAVLVRDDAVIADPFRPTQDLVDLLHMRAAMLRDDRRFRRRMTRHALQRRMGQTLHRSHAHSS